MSVSTNINEEYEKLFGKASKVDLFDPDEDYYNNLRQVIIDTPTLNNGKKELPFTGVQVIPYCDFMMMKEVKKAETNGFHVYFLKNSKPGEDDYCNAAGYYSNDNKHFIILKYSRIVYQDAFEPYDYSLVKKRKIALLKKTSMENGQFFLTKDLSCNNPKIGACLVMGIRASVDKWRDSMNTPPHKTDFDPLDDLYTLTPQRVSLQNKVEHHLFYLAVSNEIKAFGYFEPETKYFYICKGSTIEEDLQGVSESSEYALNRKRLIDNCAEKQLFGWKLVKDAKCRTAAAAATYVTGHVSNYMEWKDEKGMQLDDVYPYCFKETTKQPLIQSSLQIISENSANTHYFYIDRDFEPSHTCIATGHYDISTKEFVLHKDSVLSLEVSSMFRYSAADVQRRKFIKMNCVAQSNGYRLKTDYSCASPDQAASYVLGIHADGWKEWIDDDGKQLGEVYNITTDTE